MRKRILGVEIRYYSLEFFLYDEKINTLSIPTKGIETTRFYDAFKEGISKLGHKKYDAICFVGENKTIIFDEDREIEGDSTAGTKGAKEVEGAFDQETIKKELGVSLPLPPYSPLPRLLYIRKYFGNDKKVAKIKDFLIEQLTGYLISDSTTWEGLSKPRSNSYSETMIEKFGLSILLPTLEDIGFACPSLKDDVQKDLGLENKPKIINGCSAFASRLIALGMDETKIVDINDDEEVLVVSSKRAQFDSSYTTEPFIDGSLSLGINPSHGAALKRGKNEKESHIEEILDSNPPINLPYWRGSLFPSRCELAYATYIGGDIHDRNALCYSSLEGDAFASFDIFTSFNKKRSKIIIANNANKTHLSIKSSLFDLPIYKVKNDSPSFGAVLIALSSFEEKPLKEIQEREIKYLEVAIPNTNIKEKLHSRYESFLKYKRAQFKEKGKI
ncbi:MAG: hypothetical protein IJ247_03580 [Bacilli bacterium]|nr:hypothetical protein [Bacilli bacterium]